jgi:O-antigen ligase
MQLAAATSALRADEWQRPLRNACALWLAAAIACAVLTPAALWPLLAATAALGLLFLAFRHTIGLSVAWLLIAGATLEMTLGDWFGMELYQPVIAAVKAAEIGLGLVCMLRFGPRLDPFNPAFAYLFIFAGGLVHGLHPGLTAADSLRSLIGSAAPFVFCFSRVPLAWTQGIIRMTIWIPLLTVAVGAVLAAAGLRPLFTESGGWRLSALGHPAFLGGFCLTAIYAGLFELLRDGRRRDLALVGANFLLLLATGARAPAVYAVAVTLVVLLATRSPAFPARLRLGLLLAAGTLLPLAVLAAGALPEVRLFQVLASEASNLSGRDILWPLFERAADQSPWLGWGLGAGNVIIDPGSDVAELIGSRAAHNEYLRMSVEGGEIGRWLLIVLFLIWGLRGSGPLPRDEKLLMRLILAAFAGHAYTDNVLISTSACVFFTLITAIFARGRLEAATRRSRLAAARDGGV